MRNVIVAGALLAACGGGSSGSSTDAPGGGGPDGEGGVDAVVVADAAPCGGSFTGIGDLTGGETMSAASAISRDGTTVVGQSTGTDGPQAVRWTAAGGLVGLGDLAGGTFSSQAYGVSGDGSIVVGVSHSGLVACDGRIDEAFMWTAADGMVGLGDVDGGCFWSYAYGISEDGAVIYGGVSNALSNTAAIYSVAGGWEDLGFAQEAGHSSSFSASTPDGSLIVGTQRRRDPAAAEYEAMRWGRKLGEDLIGDLDGGAFYASAEGVSDDGTIIVGRGTSALGPEAFRWTVETSKVRLNDLAGGEAVSAADAISGDGATIVGYGTSALGEEAVVWQGGATSPTTLTDVATAAGVTIPAGWRLHRATGVTHVGDALVVAGAGVNPAGDPEGFVVRYCAP